MKENTATGLWAASTWSIASALAWAAYYAPPGSVVEVLYGLSAAFVAFASFVFFASWVDRK